MKTNNPEYNYIDRNVKIELVSDGIDPKTGVDRLKRQFNQMPIREIERRYIQDSDTLAGMLDGSITESEHFMDGQPRYPDMPISHAIYLDKSARPVHLLMRKVWSHLSTAKMPAASYRNIDKGSWRQLMLKDTQNADKPDVEAISVDNVYARGEMELAAFKDRVAGLRATYLSREDVAKVDESNIREDVWRYPTILDGRRVAIIDEVKSSGATLKIADILLRLAIPEAKFEPLYWSVPTLVRWDIYDDEGNPTSSEFAASQVPVWYDSESGMGRGIRDLDVVESMRDSVKKRRLGAYVLGRPYSGIAEMDSLSLEIMEDLNQLAARFKS
ncbi:hypothetical protein B7Y94_02745, partial [Candidatus Saccharibacteria bacterium 32-49-12]